MYIQGCAAKLIKAGKCVLGMKELLNQRFQKMVEGNNFGVVKIFFCIFLFSNSSPPWGCQYITEKSFCRCYMMSYDSGICKIY